MKRRGAHRRSVSSARGADFEKLALVLKALGNANRLALLWALREPGRARKAALDAELPMSDTGVRKHLDELVAAGLLREDAIGDGREVSYALEPRALFLALDHLRALGSVSAGTPGADDPTPTFEGRLLPALPRGPQLVLVRGLPEGRVFPLDDAGEWRVGRDAAAEVPLAADPFVSKAHAIVSRRAGRFAVQGLPGGKNGTTLNGALMEPSRWTPLSSGDLIGVGRSLLLYRSGDVR